MAIGLGGKGSMMEGSDLPARRKEATNSTRRKGGKPMYFNHPELPLEQEEPGDLEEIGEFQEFMILESEPFIDPIPDVPMDDYLEKELERQEQEELGKMLPDRIP